MQPEGGNNYLQPQGEAAPAPVQSLPPAPLQQSTAVPSEQPQSPVPYQPSPVAQSETIISWQASEYIHHEKQGLWFLGLFGGAALILLASIFILQSVTFAILIIVMSIAAAILAVRPPKIMSYDLGRNGLRINGKPFMYHEFRAFGVIQEGPLYSALLIPSKRFLPMVTLYFPAESGEQIVDILGSVLPMQHVELDFMDNLTRKLRF